MTAAPSDSRRRDGEDHMLERTFDYPQDTLKIWVKDECPIADLSTTIRVTRQGDGTSRVNIELNNRHFNVFRTHLSEESVIDLIDALSEVLADARDYRRNTPS